MNAHHRTMLAVFAGLTLIFLSAAALTFWIDASAQLDQDRGLHKRPSPLREIPEFINLTITETGIAAITTEDLRPFNWQLSAFSHNTINLTRQGEQVPYTIADDGQTIFFLAEAITSTVMAPTVYQLSLGEGLAMAERAAAAQGRGSSKATYRQVWEENSTFVADTGGADPWYGRLLLAPQTTNFPLNNIRPSGGRGRLNISVWSSTDGPGNPDHHLQVVVNDRQLADWVWDGIQHTQISVELPDGLLRPDGRNVLSLTSPGDTPASGEAIYIDRIELLYEGYLQTGQGQFWFSSNASTLTIDQADADLLLFDVTDRGQPVVLTNLTPVENGVLFTGSGANGRYFALTASAAIRPSFSNSFIAKQTLRQTDRGADYIVIYPDDTAFVDALQPLLTYRAEQGLRVTAVPLSQIYAEFGYGQEDASAIRKFLRYAQNNWRFPSPRFVLLAGDASYDIHNNLEGKNLNLVPSQLVQLPDGFASSDTWYVLPDDGLPRLAIGRFPAQTPEQLQVMVAKTLAYEQNGRSAWIERSLFVSEAEPQYNEMNLSLAALLQTSGYETSTLQMGEDEMMHYVLMGTLAKGVGVINYAGDGYVSQWGNGQMFTGDDAGMLANNGHTPIFTTFTCNNGAFSEPQRDSLAENLLWVENGGIVAAVAPSSRVALPSLTPLGELFYSALLDKEIDTLGEAILHTHAAALNDDSLAEAVLVVNLLGDPALQLQRP
ncbi:MAG: hypothetical protein IPM53_00190 [Anaerolineaceae bacterium]|nr:hypothetical protein [Anaerolineaceae bacterium]